MEIIIVHTIIIISDNFLLFWVKVGAKKQTRERKRSIIHCDKIGDAYFDNFNVWKQKSYKQIQVPKFLMFQVLKLTTDDCKKILKNVLLATLREVKFTCTTNFQLFTLIVSLWMIQFEYKCNFHCILWTQVQVYENLRSSNPRTKVWLRIVIVFSC